MKLTVKQIVKIEETLVLNGIQYDDIKLELTDHIASEIEERISIQGVPFEVALHNVFENWKEQLRPSSSHWVGLINSSPKIVLDKWVRTTKRLQLKALLIALLPTLFFAYFFNGKQNKFDYTITIQIFKIMCLAISLSIIIFKFLIFKSNIKTSFSLYFNKNATVFFIYLIFYGLGFIPIKLSIWDFGTSLFFVLLLSFLFVYSLFCLGLAYQHLQFVKKIKFT
ncbi:hypothetical protein C8C85_1720 [Flavobacterium sp. 103]|uniref:hypothetical protein n=1 Tax=Flavobacterium sp. 103 TaxID=2135624 RepID=UPI000D5EC683|nr:hypothetical protein [Flavobacterium sp. 103]PVX45911.1 hypothetical protein C8C85_1720 [Flavobacterium sp. 103]